MLVRNSLIRTFLVAPLHLTFVVSFGDKLDDFVLNSEVESSVGDADDLRAKVAASRHLKRNDWLGLKQ